VKYAAGGILTRPHLGLVAEAGPEAIIPLSMAKRSRALELYERTGRMLGGRPYAFGGFAGSIPDVFDSYADYVAPIPPVPMTAKGGRDIYITVDGVEINMSQKELEIDEDKLALRIGRKILSSIKQAYENRV